MSNDAIPDFLAEQYEKTPEDLQPLVLDFESFWERKLWHQLTNALVDFFDEEGSEDQRLDFYKVFIVKFADKINQLKLVELALKAADTYDGGWPYSALPSPGAAFGGAARRLTDIGQRTDDDDKLAFLQGVAKKVDKEGSQDAFVYASVAVARVKLDLDDLDGARKELDAAERILDTFDSVETIIHAAFYDANASYYQVGLDHAPRAGFQAPWGCRLTCPSARWTLPPTTATRSSTWRASTSTR